MLQPTDENSFCVHIPEATGAHLSLRFHLPDTYPTSSLPIFELSCDCLPSATVAELSSQLESESSTGTVACGRTVPCDRQDLWFRFDTFQAFLASFMKEIKWFKQLLVFMHNMQLVIAPEQRSVLF